MINFTVGPVQSSVSVRAIGGENVPYFRTAEQSRHKAGRNGVFDCILHGARAYAVCGRVKATVAIYCGNQV